MDWYIKCLKQYADFKGRARRKEYWMFVLINFIIALVLNIIDSFTGTINATTSVGLLGGIYSLVVLIPSLAVCVRRLHDIGKSGWYFLICMIPLVGAIILIVWYCKEGEKNENEWGPDPKAEEI